MALINCYECNREISDRANACPYCGAPAETAEEFITDVTPISEESEIMKLSEVEEKIIMLRDIPVILDSDVALLYGVETMRINEAVKNNPDKFPKGYIFELTEVEKKEVIEIFDNPKIKFSPVLPKAFPEQGLYMLATILKSKKAIDTTFEIIETFTRMRQLSRTITQVMQEPDKEKQKPLMKKAGNLVGGLLNNALPITGSETSYELNLAMVKIKHTTKRGEK